MIVEFTGCSSAGKSWVIEQLINIAGKRGIKTESAYDFVMARFGMAIKTPRAKSLMIDVFLLPWFLKAGFTYRSFIFFAFLYLCGKKEGLFMRVNIFRNLLKVLAIFLYMKTRVQERCLYIVDEGTVHSLHNLFVSYKHDLPRHLLVRLNEIPLYDTVVIVKASPFLVAERALNRPDAPWVGLQRNDWSMIACRANYLYDDLAMNSNLKKRLFVIQNDGAPEVLEKQIHMLLDKQFHSMH